MQWEGGLVNALADHAVNTCPAQVRALVDGTDYTADWCRNTLELQMITGMSGKYGKTDQYAAHSIRWPPNAHIVSRKEFAAPRQFREFEFQTFKSHHEYYWPVS